MPSPRAEDGAIVHELTAEPFDLEPGEYSFEIAVSENGSERALVVESVPLNVR